MKIQFKDLINRANKVAEEHHDMCHGAIKQEIAELKAKAIVTEGELIEREDECQTDSDHLEEALKAIQKAEDAAEMHHGGGATQI